MDSNQSTNTGNALSCKVVLLGEAGIVKNKSDINYLYYIYP
jgi:hypothetical protein